MRRPKVSQLFRQNQETTVQTPLHRFGRNSKYCRGLGLRHSLNPHQIEHFALLFGKILKDFQNALRIWTELRAAAVRLHADQATLTAPAGKPARMEASGHVVVDSPSGTAVGDVGVYDVAAQVVHLTGHVALSKDKNVMRGTALDVDVATGKARLTSGEGGRVQGLFVPAQKAPENGNP